MNVQEMVMSVYNDYEGRPIRMLMPTHGRLIRVLLNKGHTEDDLNQMCMYAMLRYIGKYDPDRSKLRTYAYVICYSYIKDVAVKCLARYKEIFSDNNSVSQITIPFYDKFFGDGGESELVRKLLKICQKSEADFVRRTYGIGCEKEDFRKVAKRHGVARGYHVVERAIRKMKTCEDGRKYQKQLDGHMPKKLISAKSLLTHGISQETLACNTGL